MPTIGKVIHTGAGIEWRIQNVYSLSLSQNNYFSPDFNFAGKDWYLWMTTDSSQKLKRKHVCVGLNKSSPGPTIIVQYSFSFKNKDGKQCEKKHLTHAFDNKWVEYPRIPMVENCKFLQTMSELVEDGILTIVCSMKQLQTAEDESDNAYAECSYCKRSFCTDVIALHENRCLENPIKLECNYDTRLRNQSDKAWNTKRGDKASKRCPYCKDSFFAEKFSAHEKRCLDKPIKCPDCSDVVLLQNWYDHECDTKTGPYNKSESFVPLHKNKILQGFKHLFLYDDDYDTVIRIKGRDFPVHKSILTALSPVFASILEKDTKKKATSIVDIKDVDPDIFSDFLRYLYTEDANNISEKNIFGLFSAADKYEVLCLKEKCIKFIKENLSVETFCDTISLALRHSDTKLINLSNNFFIQNASEIIKTMKWKKFVAENPTESNELFVKFVTSNNEKQEQYKARSLKRDIFKEKKKYNPY